MSVHFGITAEDVFVKVEAVVLSNGAGFFLDRFFFDREPTILPLLLTLKLR